MARALADERETAYVSTGHLPGPETVQSLVTEARLRALKIGLLIMAGLALIAIIPAGWLPDYQPGEIPGDEGAAKT
jgi:hypothetical protein